ncbi:hypothetical protein C4J81_10215 [Deltaproteobacteria bacterium Smac51]|nr:hypothetical protein C4J81_10215 [Deltaproteobacteria bacterium Smac51]
MITPTSAPPELDQCCQCGRNENEVVLFDLKVNCYNHKTGEVLSEGETISICSECFLAFYDDDKAALSELKGEDR